MAKPKKTTTENEPVVAENVAINKDYSATIKVLGKNYTAKGESAKEAIENLPMVRVARGMAVLTVSKEDVRKDKILTSFQTSRLFSPARLTREIALKQVSLMFETV